MVVGSVDVVVGSDSAAIVSWRATDAAGWTSAPPTDDHPATAATTRAARAATAPAAMPNQRVEGFRVLNAGPSRGPG